MERVLTSSECDRAAEKLWLAAYAIQDCAPKKLFGVPRGGIPVSYLVQGYSGLGCELVDDAEAADLIVDDIRDSGRTKAFYKELCPHTPFLALSDFIDLYGEKRVWLVFPWEVGSRDTSADDLVVRLLQHIGENPNREGLRDTPARVLKAWKEMTVGYTQEPASILKKDFDAKGYDEIIVCPWIEFYSTCEHHLLPFSGYAHVAYLPSETGGRVVGLSKLARLVDCFARRLQIQELMTVQIADALGAHLNPRGVAVVVQAQHLCMACRGVQKHHARMVTSAMRGVFKESDSARAEFFSLISSARQ